MKKKRLWLAAPALALLVVAVPMNDTEAADVEDFYAFEPEITFELADRQLLEDAPKLTLQNVANYVIEGSRSLEATRVFQIDVDETLTNDNFTQLVAPISEQIKEAFNQDEYVYGNRMRASWEYVGLGKTVTVTVTYTYPIAIEKEHETTAYVKKVASEIFHDNMTDFEKVKAAYDYIILNTTYGEAPEEDGGGHSIYSIIKDGVGVCQAYALLFQRLMEEAGIPSKYIVGYKGEAHAWNLVEIDGETYYIDATHGDPVFSGGNGPKDYITYSRFLMSEAQLLSHGYIIQEERPYVTPNSTKYSDWHEIDHPFVWNNQLIYKTKTHQLKSAIVQGDGIATKILDENSHPLQMMEVNGRIIYYDNEKRNNLMELLDDGSIRQVTLGYINDGTKESSIDRIEIKDNKLMAYDYFDKNIIIYEEVLETEPGPTPEPGPTLEEQINDVFAPNSLTVQAIEAAVSEQEFKKLLTDLKVFIEASLTNPQLQYFKEKVAKYNKVQQEISATTPWTNNLPTDINQDKVWTITFEGGVVAEDAKQEIYVTDIFGKRVLATIDINGAVVTVTPNGRYEAGATYYLVIPAGVKSAEGDELKEAISVAFTPQ